MSILFESIFHIFSAACKIVIYTPVKYQNANARKIIQFTMKHFSHRDNERVIKNMHAFQNIIEYSSSSSSTQDELLYLLIYENIYSRCKKRSISSLYTIESITAKQV